ncbi:MAG TPA: hypothetical protein VGU01_06875 [Sphingomicrobium sp.]|nr:hypothetical protein [Sphingomicrobium sp.]
MKRNAFASAPDGGAYRGEPCWALLVATARCTNAISGPLICTGVPSMEAVSRWLFGDG